MRVQRLAMSRQRRLDIFGHRRDDSLLGGDARGDKRGRRRRDRADRTIRECSRVVAQHGHRPGTPPGERRARSPHVRGPGPHGFPSSRADACWRYARSGPGARISAFSWVSGPESSSLGLVGALVQHSPTVDAALRSLTVHLHLQSRGGVPTRTVEGERAALGYAIYQPGMPGSAQVHDATMAIAFNIMRTLCGSSWQPSEVRFAHREPADVQPYRRFFCAPLRFDTDRTEDRVPPAMARAALCQAPTPSCTGCLQSQVSERETRCDDGPAEEVQPRVADDARSPVVARRSTWPESSR